MSRSRDYKIRPESRFQPSLLGLAKLRKRRRLGVGIDRFRERDLLTRLKRHRSSFVLPRDRRVQPPKRIDRLHRVVCPKGQRYMVIQEALPRVRVLYPLGSQAILGPVHVCQQVRRLHGSNHAQILKPLEVVRQQHLRMLDPQPKRLRTGFRRGFRHHRRIWIHRRWRQARRPRHLLGCRKGIERHGVRLVADRMEAKLKPSRRPLRCHPVQVGLVVSRQTAVLRIIRIGLSHRRRPRPQRPVHEALQHC